MSQLDRIRPPQESAVLVSGRAHHLARVGGDMAKALVFGAAALGAIELAQHRPMPGAGTIPAISLYICWAGFIAFPFFFSRALVPWGRKKLVSMIARKRLRDSGAALVRIRDLARIPDGTAVMVQGRVQGHGDIPSLSSPRQGVFACWEIEGGDRGLTNVPRTCVERRRDFALIDGDDPPLSVDAQNAILMSEPSVPATMDVGTIQRRLLAPLESSALTVNGAGDPGEKIQVTETMIVPGDRVTVYGYKDSKMDPEGSTMGRQTPTSPILRPGQGPIVIIRS